MPLVAHAKVSVSACGRHEEAAPARKPIMDARDRVDHTAIKRKQKQVLEARRKVPTRPWLVEDAVAGNGALVLESGGEECDRRDVLVLDPVAVVPEATVRFEHGRIDLALAEVALGLKSFGEGRRRRGTGVIPEVRDSLRGCAHIARVSVLVHVEDHVHALRASPGHHLGDAIEVGLAELTSLRLQQAPGKREAYRVEAE